MTERDNELDALLKDAQGYITDAKDLTGELDIDALMRELNMTEGASAGVPAVNFDFSEPAEGAAESATDMGEEFPVTEDAAEEIPVFVEETAEADNTLLTDDTVLLVPDVAEETDETSADADLYANSEPTVKIAIPEEDEEDEKPSKARKDRKAERKAKKETQTSDEKKKSEDELPGYATVIHDIAFLLVIVCLLFTFVVRIIGVKGSSMVPTLSEGDRILLVSDFLVKDYKNGDVVVCVSDSYNSQVPLVKRVIATEGQTVDIDFKTGTVTVDGEKLSESYINEKTHYNPSEEVSYPITVEEGCVFVMGDNRNRSTDSRDSRVGQISEDQIIGKVFYRIAPFKVFGKIR